MGKLRHFAVEKGRPAFDPLSHQHAVEFEQQVVWQPGGNVGGLGAAKARAVIAPARPSPAVEGGGALVWQIGRLDLGFGGAPPQPGRAQGAAIATIASKKLVTAFTRQDDSQSSLGGFGKL